MRKNKFFISFITIAMVITTMTMGILTLFDTAVPDPITPAEEVHTYLSRRLVNGVAVDYQSISEAISAAQEGETVEVLQSHDISQTIVIDKQISLFASAQDIALTRSNNFSGSFFNVLEDGQLTLGRDVEIGSLIVDGQNKMENTSPLVLCSGSLVMKKGSIITKANGATHGSAIKVDGGSFTLQGGQLMGNTVASAEFNGAVYATNDATVTIASGQIDTNAFEGQVAGVFADDGTITMTNGTITTMPSKYDIGFTSTSVATRFSMSGGNVGNVIGTGSNMTLSNGTVSTILAKDAQVNITGALVTNQIACDSNTTLNFSNGTVAKVTVLNEQTQNVTYHVEGDGITMMDMYDSTNVNLQGGAFVGTINLHTRQSISVLNNLTTSKKMVLKPDTYQVGAVLVEFNTEQMVDLTKFDVFDSENYELSVLSKQLVLAPKTNFDVTLNSTSFVVTGQTITPTVEVRLEGQLLVKDTHYTLEGDLNAVQVGSYQIIVKGMGAYANKQKIVSWSIVENPSDLTIELDQNEFEYTGNEIVVTFTVKIGTQTLAENFFTVVSGDHGTEPGVYTLTIHGADVYEGKQGIINWEILPSTQPFALSLVQDVFLFDGNAKTPVIVVKVNGQEVSPEFYIVSGQTTATEIGEYEIIVTGVAFYNNQDTIVWRIVNNNSAFQVNVEPASFVFDGNVKEPLVTVHIGDLVLTNNVDYTLSGSTSGTNAGSYLITVTGAGNYSGTGYVEWEILPYEFVPQITLDNQTFVYNQQAQAPVVSVFFGEILLTENVDYTLADNTSETNVGDYVVSVILKGNYTGENSANWSIIENSSPLNIELDAQSFVYTGSNITPIVTVKVGETVLNTDKYTLSGTLTEVNSNTYTITATGQNGYTGTGETTWTITPITDDLTVEITPATYLYDGTTKTPTITVKHNATVLSPSQYQIVSGITSNSQVGDYTVQVEGLVNYTGLGSGTWSILPNSQPLLITLSQTSYTYSKTYSVPTATVRNAVGTVLTQNVDYYIVVASGNFMDAKTYTMTAKGMGNYSGEAQANWIINPKPIVVEWSITSTTYSGTAIQSIPSTDDFVSGDVVSLTPAQSYTDAGTYTISTSLSGPAAENYQILGQASTSLVISKKYIILAWSPTGVATYTYNGTAQGPTASIGIGVVSSDVGNVTLNVSGNLQTNVGSYTATATISGARSHNYMLQNSTKNYTIEAIALTGVTFTTTNYTGTLQTAAIATVTPSGATFNFVSGSTQTNAGTHTVQIAGTGNYSGTVSGSWVINRLSVNIVWNPSGDAEWDYDGAAHGPTVSSISGVLPVDAGQVSAILTSGTAVNAGSYTAQATLSGGKSTNYTIVSGASKPYIIYKGDISPIIMNGLNVNYNTAAHSIVPTLPSGASVTSYSTQSQTYNTNGSLKTATTVSGNIFTNAGRYSITAYITGGANYNDATAYAVLQIYRAPVTLTAAAKTSTYGSAIVPLTYDIISGTVYSQDQTNVQSTLTITTTATSASNVGAYPITLTTVGHANYAITCNNNTYTITAVAPTLAFGSSSYTLMQGDSGSATATTNSPVSITYSSDNSSIVSINVTTGAISTSIYQSFGTTVIRAAVAANGNYLAASTSATVTVTKSVAMVGTTYYASFDAARTAASNGATIAIVGSFSVSSSISLDGKNLTIRSGKEQGYVDIITRASSFFGPIFNIDRSNYIFGSSDYGTIRLDGQNVSNSSPLMHIQYVETSIYDQSITINSGMEFVNNRTSGNGGAIFNQGIDIVLNGGVFDSNIANGDGGAIYGAVANASNAIFRKNFAFGQGGAIFLQHYNGITFTGLQFIGNDCYMEGGAIYKYSNGAFNIVNCTMSGNTSLGEGHVLYVKAGTVSITNSNISDNDGYAQEQGSNGVFLIAVGATLNIISGTYENNTSEGGEGGLFTNRGTLNISSGTFNSNFGYSNGILVNLGTATITGGTFSNITNSYWSSGSIYNTSGSSLYIRGGTFSNNNGRAIYNVGRLFLSGTISMSDDILMRTSYAISVDNTLNVSSPIKLTPFTFTIGSVMVTRTNAAYALTNRFTLTDAAYKLSTSGNNLVIANA